MFKAVH